MRKLFLLLLTLTWFVLPASYDAEVLAQTAPPVIKDVKPAKGGYLILGQGFGRDKRAVRVLENGRALSSKAVVAVKDSAIQVLSRRQGSFSLSVVIGKSASKAVKASLPRANTSSSKETAPVVQPQVPKNQIKTDAPAAKIETPKRIETPKKVDVPKVPGNQPVISGVAAVEGGYLIQGKGFGRDKRAVRVFENNRRITSAAILAVKDNQVTVASQSTGRLVIAVQVGRQKSRGVRVNLPRRKSADTSNSRPSTETKTPALPLPGTTTKSEDQPPVIVAIEAPGTVELGDTFKVSIEAKDDQGVVALEPRVNGRGNSVRLRGRPQEVLSADLKADRVGSMVIEATALDTAGQRSQRFQITVKVVNQAATETATLPKSENQPPKIQSVELPKSVPVGSTLSISVAAIDDKGVVALELIIGGERQTVRLGGAASETFSAQMIADRQGAFEISVQALDREGLRSAPYQATVNVLSGNQAPQITALKVPEVVGLGGQLDLSVTATDDQGVTALELTIDGTTQTLRMKGGKEESLTANLLADRAGTFVVSAVAIDGEGARSVPVSRQVSVGSRITEEEPSTEAPEPAAVPVLLSTKLTQDGYLLIGENLDKSPATTLIVENGQTLPPEAIVSIYYGFITVRSDSYGEINAQVEIDGQRTNIMSIDMGPRPAPEILYATATEQGYELVGSRFGSADLLLEVWEDGVLLPGNSITSRSSDKIIVTSDVYGIVPISIVVGGLSSNEVSLIRQIATHSLTAIRPGQDSFRLEGQGFGSDPGALEVTKNGVAYGQGDFVLESDSSILLNERLLPDDTFVVVKNGIPSDAVSTLDAVPQITEINLITTDTTGVPIAYEIVGSQLWLGEVQENGQPVDPARIHQRFPTGNHSYSIIRVLGALSGPVETKIVNIGGGSTVTTANHPGPARSAPDLPPPNLAGVHSFETLLLEGEGYVLSLFNKGDDLAAIDVYENNIPVPHEFLEFGVGDRLLVKRAPQGSISHKASVFGRLSNSLFKTWDAAVEPEPETTPEEEEQPTSTDPENETEETATEIPINATITSANQLPGFGRFELLGDFPSLSIKDVKVFRDGNEVHESAIVAASPDRVEVALGVEHITLTSRVESSTIRSNDFTHSLIGAPKIAEIRLTNEGYSLLAEAGKGFGNDPSILEIREGTLVIKDSLWTLVNESQIDVARQLVGQKYHRVVQDGKYDPYYFQFNHPPALEMNDLQQASNGLLIYGQGFGSNPESIFLNLGFAQGYLPSLGNSQIVNDTTLYVNIQTQDQSGSNWYMSVRRYYPEGAYGSYRESLPSPFAVP